jgi:hypothetical protein
MAVSEDRYVDGVAGGRSSGDRRTDGERFVEAEIPWAIDITSHSEGPSAGRNCRLLLRPCVRCVQQKNAKSRSSLQVH